MAVSAVSAVPTNRGSAVSVSEVEKTPESAITPAPHTDKKMTSTTVEATKKSGDARQHVSLISNAASAVGARPHRSDAHPPARHPTVPATPIARKAINPVDDATTSPR